MTSHSPSDQWQQNFTALDLRHKDTVSGFLHRDPPLTSELTFTNLFMWRHHYRPHWTVREDCLVLVCLPPDLPPFALPLVGKGDKPKALGWLRDQFALAGEPFSLQRLSRSDLEQYVDSSLYSSVPEPDQDDYVYLTDDLIRLSGRRFHQKKNHVNQFLKRYDFEWHHLDHQHIMEIMAMQESWCSLKNCSIDPSLFNEDLAVSEALSNFEDLGYLGLIVKVNGKLEAFTLGEWLNHQTAVVHIEKANPDINGLYTVVNQLFCREALSSFKFINREQDLGVAGLRSAKQSYNPHHMVEKYLVTART